MIKYFKCSTNRYVKADVDVEGMVRYILDINLNDQSKYCCLEAPISVFRQTFEPGREIKKDEFDNILFRVIAMISEHTKE